MRFYQWAPCEDTCWCPPGSHIFLGEPPGGSLAQEEGEVEEWGYYDAGHCHSSVVIQVIKKTAAWRIALCFWLLDLLVCCK